MKRGLPSVKCQEHYSLLRRHFAEVLINSRSILYTQAVVVPPTPMLWWWVFLVPTTTPTATTTTTPTPTSSTNTSCVCGRGGRYHGPPTRNMEHALHN